MPIYEFECDEHGRFELLLPLGRWSTRKMPCPTCEQPSERTWSLAKMKPDPFWAGHVLENYGYVTSSSQVLQIQQDRHLVEVGDRADMEAIHKTAESNAKSKREKFAKETRAFVEEEFTGKGMIDSDGQLTPEANRPLSDKPITDTKDERLKS